MENIVFTQLSIRELRSHFRKELEDYFASKKEYQEIKTDQLFTIDEAATFLNLKKATLYSMVQRREIPVNKRGNRLYFSKEELIEWVKGGRKMTNFDLKSLVNTTYRKTNKR